MPSSAIVIFSTAGLIAILALTTMAGLVVQHLDIPPQYYFAARLVLVVIGLNITVSLVSGVYGGIPVGLQQLNLTNSIEVGINVLRGAQRFSHCISAP